VPASDATCGRAHAASAGGVPDGLSAGDWSSLRGACEAGRHAAVAIDGGYAARNPEQHWLTRFDGRGFSTAPDAGGWTWGLQLERYGFAGEERAVTGPAQMSAAGQRVACDRDDALQEWYVNDARGLEQGFTVRQRPPQDRDGPLTLLLGRLPDAVAAAHSRRAPNELCEFAFSLAQEFSRFYSACHILSETDADLRASRLRLAQLLAPGAPPQIQPGAKAPTHITRRRRPRHATFLRVRRGASLHFRMAYSNCRRFRERGWFKGTGDRLWIGDRWGPVC